MFSKERKEKQNKVCVEADNSHLTIALLIIPLSLGTKHENWPIPLLTTL